MLDRFSGHADIYARYRIDYPDALYDFILSVVAQRGAAWDCATGNGQVATALARFFDHVEATDLSETQIGQAPVFPNVRYQVSQAEKTPFADAQFDLVTVGQALHWFDATRFYKEVDRVLKPRGVLAVWTYGNATIDETVNPIFETFYTKRVGQYWPIQKK